LLVTFFHLCCRKHGLKIAKPCPDRGVQKQGFRSSHLREVVSQADASIEMTYLPFKRMFFMER
jgi:hypothetical protein